ncbi:MAG: hypothetical protein F7C35_07115 [Desulfurococcales archaeon]|nr:hypothetical protein [Desulfurococcales archaeon]
MVLTLLSLTHTGWVIQAYAQGQAATYLDCTNGGLGLYYTMLRDAATGGIEEIILFTSEGNLTLLRNDLNESLEIVGLGKVDNQPVVALLDRMKGTLIVSVLKAEATGNSSGAVSLSKALRPKLEISLENGFIKDAYGFGANQSLTLLVRAVIVQGFNTTVESLVRITLKSFTTRPQVEDVPLPSLGLAPRSLSECHLSIANYSNNRIDIGVLRGLTHTGGDYIYHVAAGGLPGIDVYSISSASFSQSLMVATTVQGHPSKPYFIVVKRRESQAFISITGPVEGVAAFKPLDILQVNSTTYLVSLLYIRSDGTVGETVAMITLGVPQVKFYWLSDGINIALTGQGVALAMKGGSPFLVPIARLVQFLRANSINVTVENATTTWAGVSVEPLRTEPFDVTNVTVTQVKPSETPQPAGNTTTQGTGTSTSQTPTPPAGGTRAQVNEAPRAGKGFPVKLVAAAGGISVVGALAAFMVLRRRKDQPLGEARFEY